MLERLQFSVSAWALLTGVVAGLCASSLSFAQGGEQSPAVAETGSASGPAPRRDISGTWAPLGGTRVAIQAGGVQAMPNDGDPEHVLPYTPYGREVYESHRALEGVDAVMPAEGNDPRNKCEPLGFPRINHYNIRMTQIFQDAYKLAVLYQYDNRWRNIWIDGRELPEIVDGGVMAGGTYKASKWYGYSVGEWVDDYTLVVRTVGIMPEDRIWLDSTGRPISDAATIEEVFRRIDADHMEWTETIDDPKLYTEPWVSMNIRLRLADPHTDIIEMYCSPVELQYYYDAFGDAASGVESN